MKRKKLLAMLLAATMVLGSAMTVSAAGTDESDATGSTITGTGDVNYENTTIYNVALPTTTGINLTVDPQGLSSLENGETATAEDLADAAGKITCATIVPIVNNGSVPVKVTMELTLTGDATAVTTEAAVDTGTDTNILLYAIPSAVDTKDDAGYQSSSTGIVLSTTAATVNFVLPAAKYVFSKDASGVTTYIKDTTSDSHGTAIEFKGKVNKNANWKDYAGTSKTKSIGMTAKFTFTHTLTDTDKADTAEGAPYAMMAYSGTKVTVTAEPATPQIPESDGTTDIVIAYTGADPVAGQIEVSRPDGTTITPAEGAYTSGKIVIDTTEKTVTLTATWLAGQKSNATGEYSVTIDGIEYGFKIN